MLAACTTTPSSSPCVSTATWRLRPFSRLAASQPRGPLFRRLDALGVDDGRGGTGLPPFSLPQHDNKMVAQALPDPRCEEGPKVAVHCGPRWESWRGRQVPPLAASAHDIEQAIQQAAHVCGPRPPTGFGGRDERLQQPILVIAQRLAGPKIPNQHAILKRPHRSLPAREPPRTPSPQSPSPRQADQHTLSKQALRPVSTVTAASCCRTSIGF